jgi:mRNA-degrading endonuclease toxin of MazEF toxin-antitoxin module
MDIKKWQVWRIELPVQNIVKKDGGRNIEVTGSEQHSAHRCVVLAVDPDGQFAIVVPLTSAQHSNGAERWAAVKKSWYRTYHIDRYVEILTEQIRYVDIHRFNEQEGELGQYDRDQLDLKLKALLGFI